MILRGAVNGTGNLEEGGFTAPSCCMLFVNILMFLLTYISVVNLKGDISVFWQPSEILHDLEIEFRSI